jgi:hypothetical protein
MPRKSSEPEEPIEVTYVPALLPPVNLKPDRRQHSGGALNIPPPAPECVEQVYFYAWMDHQRRLGKNYQTFLRDNWESYAGEGVPFYDVSPHTVRSWVKRHDWDRKATDIIAQNYPYDTMRQNAQLVAMADLGLDEAVAILHGERDHLPGHALLARTKMVELVWQARGLGTFGSITRAAPVIKQAVAAAIDAAAMSEQEIGRARQDMLYGSKTPHEERRR